MKRRINLWSFVYVLVCSGLFFLLSITSFFTLMKRLLGVNPYDILLALSACSFIFGAFGFVGVSDWKTTLRSVTTVVIGLLLTVVLSFIVFMGKLFE
ncbi:hypothetical protein PAECIP111893_02503 [Paenibacillus plantiphilus]|uniref:Uncharacterized protein n=1 Tax=Paenibacillus plantiphilus TaxID=2905650 RepID=A0ABN8GHF4_9BACL|nr:hypothetical protein PAECIP111893_02503 [Paenibacillus plantiphilus]